MSDHRDFIKEGEDRMMFEKVVRSVFWMFSSGIQFVEGVYERLMDNVEGDWSRLDFSIPVWLSFGMSTFILYSDAGTIVPVQLLVLGIIVVYIPMLFFKYKRESGGINQPGKDLIIDIASGIFLATLLKIFVPICPSCRPQPTLPCHPTRTFHE